MEFGALCQHTTSSTYCIDINAIKTFNNFFYLSIVLDTYQILRYLKNTCNVDFMTPIHNINRLKYYYPMNEFTINSCRSSIPLVIITQLRLMNTAIIHLF